MVKEKTVLFNLVNKVSGKGEIIKQREIYKGIKKELSEVSQVTERSTKTQKEQTQVISGFNEEGGRYQKIIKTTTPITESQRKAEERRAAALQKPINKQMFFNEQMERTGKSGAEISSAFSNMGGVFDEFGRPIQKNGKQFDNLNSQLDESINKSQQFHAEYLGVMFAGMALSRTMSRLTQTSKGWLGMNEIMNTTLGVVTLPAMMEFNNLVLSVSEGLMGLSESTKMSIGVAALSFQGVGAIMSTVGQMGLATFALKDMFPKANITSGKLLKGSIGLSLAISGFTMLASGLSEDDLKSEIVGLLLGVGGTALLGASFGGLPGALAGLIISMSASILMKISDIKMEKGSGREAAEKFNKETNDALKEISAGNINTSVNIPENARGMTAKELIESSAEEYGAVGKFGQSSFVGGVDSTDTSRNFVRSIIERYNPEKRSFLDKIFGISLAVGSTNIPENGMYMLHQGEQVLRKDQAGGGQNITIQYNITASSMKEFESKLRESERRITSDIRRLS